MLQRLIFEVFVIGLAKVQSSFDLPPLAAGNDEPDPEVSSAAKFENEEEDLTSVEFHVAMLSISLIAGLLYCGYVVYNWWYQRRPFLFRQATLMTALVCRTFFTLLIASVVVLGGSDDVAGANTLVSFECICGDLVLAFWLIFTIYLHECVQNDFRSEPSLKIYDYGITGISLFFSLTWIFILADEYGNIHWFFMNIGHPTSLWIVGTLRLLYLFLQFGLLLNIVRLIEAKKGSFDNDCLPLFRKSEAAVGALAFLFWLHFGFVMGRSPASGQTYLYFDFLVDGLQCAVTCPLLYFLDKWGRQILGNVSGAFRTKSSRIEPEKREEALMASGQTNFPSVSTTSVDSVCPVMGGAVGRESETPDVVFSNVVTPARLLKTFHLYKRFKVFPVSEVTVVSGEKFYECRDEIGANPSSGNAEMSITKPFQIHSADPIERFQKKNAFYASKYLVVDDKEKFPVVSENRFSS